MPLSTVVTVTSDDNTSKEVICTLTDEYGRPLYGYHVSSD